MGYDVVTFKIDDKDAHGSNDFLGQTLVHVGALSLQALLTPQTPAIEQWFPLVNKDGKKDKERGDILLRLAYAEADPTSTIGQLCQICRKGNVESKMIVDGKEKLCCLPCAAKAERDEMRKAVKRVEVEVIEAKDLLAADRGGTSDPRVKVKLGSKKVFETQKKDKTLAPQWNEKTVVELFDQVNEVLTFEVEDVDKFSNDFLGIARVPVHSIVLAGGVLDKWYELLDESAANNAESKKNRGLLRLRFTYTDGHGQRFANPVNNGQALPAHVTTTPVKRLLHVDVLRARNLIGKDSSTVGGAKSDPFFSIFCKMSKDAALLKTSVIEATVDPEWNESFDVILADEVNDVVTLRCQDQDLVSGADFLGDIFLYAGAYSLRPNQPIESWFQLLDKDSQKAGKERGEALLRVTYIEAPLTT